MPTPARLPTDMSRNVKQPVSTRRVYVVDWVLAGSYEVAASSAEEAQDLFDEAWGSPSKINPLRDGEVTNDMPYPRGAE